MVVGRQATIRCGIGAHSTDRRQRSGRSRTPWVGCLSDGADGRSTVRHQRGTVSAIRAERRPGVRYGVEYSDRRELCDTLNLHSEPLVEQRQRDSDMTGWHSAALAEREGGLVAAADGQGQNGHRPRLPASQALTPSEASIALAYSARFSAQKAALTAMSPTECIAFGRKVT